MNRLTPLLGPGSGGRPGRASLRGGRTGPRPHRSAPAVDRLQRERGGGGERPTTAIRRSSNSARLRKSRTCRLGTGWPGTWIFRPAKNMLFLKPVEAYASTNLTVLTARPALDGSGEADADICL